MRARLELLSRFARPAAAIAAAGLLAWAADAPLWIARLAAPQYPKGLWLRAYGDGFEGDITEINTLNHYVGMRPLDETMIPELALYPLALGAIAVLALAGLALRGRFGALATLGLWAAPVVALADIQRWLHRFGHDLDPESALRLEPFTPLVLGPTKVWNFRIEAYPGPALVAFVLIALVITLARRAPHATPPPRLAVAASSAALALVLGACAPATAHGHGTASLHAPHAAGGAPWLAAPELAGAAFDLAGALAAARDGSEVRVPAGTYRGHFTIARAVALVADGHVVLDGGGRGTVLTLAAPGASVRGFHVRGSGGQIEDAAAVAVLAGRTAVEHVLVTDSYTGILVRDSDGVRIVGNRILGPRGLSGDAADPAAHDHAPTGSVGDGISVWGSRGLLVRENEIDGVRDGIYLSYASEVLVDSNSVTGSRYAIHAMFGEDHTIFGNTITANASGLVLMYGRRVEASRNVIADHRAAATGYGVLLKDVTEPRLVENVVRHNVIGLKAEGVEPGEAPAKALRNELSYNAVGAQLFPTAALVFAQNAFVDNLHQVEVRGGRSRAEWRDRGVGNYWSDHRGYDLDGDTVSDVPHVSGAAAPSDLRALTGTLAGRLFERAARAWSIGSGPRVVDRVPLAAPSVASVAPARDAGDAAPWLLLASLGGAAAGVPLALSRRRR
ncbi:MAG TPA: NosD domain-containing protein [Candidatus Limnocylindria bacterium]|nr:NosD domain-containing protein [Candidatus Limnocylindria bacterium]